MTLIGDDGGVPVSLDIPDTGIARRWLGRCRARVRATSMVSTVTSGDGALRIGVRHDGPQHVTVEVDGLLVREHAQIIDEVLARAFGIHRAWFVIDLRRVTRLDPTTLSAITRNIDAVRRNGALVTLVPPGRHDRSAA